MRRTASRLLMLMGGLGIALGLLWRDRLPPPAHLDAAVLAMPDQGATNQPPFSVQVGGIRYGITPVQSYEIAGLVVSRHDSSAWWDWIHAAWNDHLNVADLCVVYGDNARSGSYEKLRFSSGQFVCEVRADTAEAWQAFVPEALSNNHVLTDRPAAARLLRDLRVGDQVRLRGWLVEYRHEVGGGFMRGTSMSRSDTGNGACETVWVNEVRVLARVNPIWHLLPWLGLCSLIAGAVLWMTLPMRVHD